MPPKRRSNLPANAAKGRRPRVAGTAGPAKSQPAKGQLVRPTAPLEKPTPASTKATPTVKAQSLTAQDKSGAAEKAASSKSLIENPVSNAKPFAPTKSVSLAKPKVPNLQPRIVAQTSAAEVGKDEKPASRITWTLVSVIAGAAVALGAFAGVAAFKPGAQVNNTAWVDTKTTAEVTNAAKDAVTAISAYDYQKIDDYVEGARAVLNDEMREEFDLTAETTKAAVVQGKMSTEASVTDAGVSVLDGDRAELTVYLNVSGTRDGVVEGSSETALGVKMEKIDGEWLLSGIDRN